MKKYLKHIVYNSRVVMGKLTITQDLSWKKTYHLVKLKLQACTKVCRNTKAKN